MAGRGSKSDGPQAAPPPDEEGGGSAALQALAKLDPELHDAAIKTGLIEELIRLSSKVDELTSKNDELSSKNDELSSMVDSLSFRVRTLEQEKDRPTTSIGMPERSESPGVSDTSQSSLLPGRHPVSVLKEFCDRMYWAAPKYEMVETRSTGFVFQASLEPPATATSRHIDPGVRRLLKAVDSEPCPTHKKAKERAAQKLILILQGSGIRV